MPALEIALAVYFVMVFVMSIVTMTVDSNRLDNMSVYKIAIFLLLQPILSIYWSINENITIYNNSNK